MPELPEIKAEALRHLESSEASLKKAEEITEILRRAGIDVLKFEEGNRELRERIARFRGALEA